MRNECWVNLRLPARRDLLAKVLGVSEQLIDDSLPAVIIYFNESDGYIFSAELEDYRKYLEERKEKQSRGGKVGSAMTNRKRYPSKTGINTDVASTPSSNSKPPRRVTRRDQVESLVEHSKAQHSQNQSIEKEVIEDPWIDKYEAEEALLDNGTEPADSAEAYERESNGY
jgi:hypothetical protein